MSLSRRQIYGLLAAVFAFAGLSASVVLLFRAWGSTENPARPMLDSSAQIASKDVSGPLLVIVYGNDKWRDTGIHVDKGQKVAISASGMVTWAPVERVGSNVVGPDGTRPPYPQDALGFPMPHAGIGSLVMRIGESRYAVGSRDRIEVRESGTIEFMVNDDVVGDNSGSFTISVLVGKGSPPLN